MLDLPDTSAEAEVEADAKNSNKEHSSSCRRICVR